MKSQEKYLRNGTPQCVNKHCLQLHTNYFISTTVYNIICILSPEEKNIPKTQLQVQQLALDLGDEGHDQ